jgi:hypothetical protein
VVSSLEGTCAPLVGHYARRVGANRPRVGAHATCVGDAGWPGQTLRGTV